MKILIFPFFILFVSCHSVNDTKQTSLFDDFYKVPYIISVKDSLRNKHTDSLAQAERNYLPPPPSLNPKTIGEFGIGYGVVNIIFYKNNSIFMHQINGLSSKGICGTGLKEDEVDLLNLKPNDLIQIPEDALWKIILKNGKLNSYGDKFGLIVLSSFSDTITNSFFTKIIDSMKVNHFNSYAVRRISEEEKNVLTAKTKKIPYYKSDYEWKMKYRNELVRINYLPPKIKKQL